MTTKDPDEVKINLALILQLMEETANLMTDKQDKDGLQEITSELDHFFTWYKYHEGWHKRK